MMLKPPCSVTNLRQLPSNSSSCGSTATTATTSETSDTTTTTMMKQKQKKNGVTYSKQDTLPLLPIPDLSITMQRLEQRLEALHDTEEQRQQTKRDIHEFLSKDGPKLYQALQEYETSGRTAGMIGSYVEEFWNEAYLQPDMSVVLNLNPYFVLEQSPDPKMIQDQIRYASALTYAALQMACMTNNEQLVPDTFRNQALCMHQFSSLFAASRQPTPNINDMDDVHVFRDSTHVVVLCQNQFYYFVALWPPENETDTDDDACCSTVAVNEADIYDILHAIQTHATTAMSTNHDDNMNNDSGSSSSIESNGIGVLTSLPRSQWAMIRQEICDHHESNSTTLRMIDSALFILVLDDYIPDTVHAAAANMLHGTNLVDDTPTAAKNCNGNNDRHYQQIGTCLNRWYDKLQLIVCKDGTSGLIFEHSTVDGHTALRFVSDVFAETVITFAESIIDLIHGRGTITHVLKAVVDRAVLVNNRRIGSEGRFLDVRPKKLIFDISESIRDKIRFAEASLCDEIHSTDTHILEYKSYGKRLIVANQMSPDALVQMSILLAYYTMYGKVECMYEPALTKHFFHGRTEAIRGTTMQAKQFCEIYCNPKSTTEEKLNALRIATTEHSRLTKEASAGQGVDRLLFALKCIATRTSDGTGIVPPFFRSDSWKTLNHTVLSTSNCGNPALRLFGFGPVVPNGFGIGYIIKDDAISYSVCSKRRQTARYVQTLERCLNEIQAMLQPISSVSVDHPEIKSLSKTTHKKTAMEADTPTSYDDIWGENESVFSPHTLVNKGAVNGRSLYSSRVHEQSIRGDLLSVSAIDILLNDDNCQIDDKT